jgi:membrane protein implicated in regulation of membrane protease activity
MGHIQTIAAMFASARQHRKRSRELCCGLLIALTQGLVFASTARAADAPPPTDPYIPIWVAIIAFVGSVIVVILQLGYNARAARKTENAKAAAEQRQRQSELALKIVDTIAAKTVRLVASPSVWSRSNGLATPGI